LLFNVALFGTICWTADFLLGLPKEAFVMEQDFTFYFFLFPPAVSKHSRNKEETNDLITEYAIVLCLCVMTSVLVLTDT